MTAARNHAFYAFCAAMALLASLPPDILAAFPASWRPYVVAASAFAMWARGHSNLFEEPPK